MIKYISIQWKFSGQLFFFQGKRKLLKNPECKNYVQWSENFQGNFVFQGKCKLFKILKDKKYIQFSEFRAHSVFQGKHKLLKNPGCKNYIQYREKFQEKLCFQSKRKFLKNPYFSAVKIFRANSVFQGKRKLFKSLKDKKSEVKVSRNAVPGKELLPVRRSG